MADLLIDKGFDVVTLLITLIPIDLSIGSLPSWLGGAVSLISVAGQFVPLDIFVFCIGNIAIWVTIHMAISLIRFVLDFLPFF